MSAAATARRTTAVPARKAEAPLLGTRNGVGVFSLDPTGLISNDADVQIALLELESAS
jgi:hypothetical protein